MALGKGSGIALEVPLAKGIDKKISCLKSLSSCSDIAEVFNESHSAVHKCCSHFCEVQISQLTLQKVRS